MNAPRRRSVSSPALLVALGLGVGLGYLLFHRRAERPTESLCAGLDDSVDAPRVVPMDARAVTTLQSSPTARGAFQLRARLARDDAPDASVAVASAVMPQAQAKASADAGPAATTSIGTRLPDAAVVAGLSMDPRQVLRQLDASARCPTFSATCITAPGKASFQTLT